ncbi:hypothetical protein F4809DRAFT_616394 [Biscogniauxia mediterranea]|nr:hypothetical protein F4809DRAFT_616394 [Biscogniauxia mediterranea]
MRRVVDTAFLAFGLLTLGGFARAAESDSKAESCCSSLTQAGLGDRLLYPQELGYESRIESYWSVSAQTTPRCIVQPVSATEVSRAVVALVANPACKFAVRSGGAMVWRGAANIEDGVTIDLGNMNSTTYYPDNGTVRMLPGATWSSVYNKLDGLGVTVPGGRIGHVGVGGLITGGGNSFLSARTGMVCDSVVNFEVVLASGEIVNANKQTNSDLFKALKGGSFNFGIVTHFDMEALPSPRIWAGVTLHSAEDGDSVIDSIADFADNAEKDPSSSSAVFWTYRPPSKQSVIAVANVNTEGVEAPSIYKNFMRIPSIASSQRMTNMSDITSELTQPTGYRNMWFTLSFKNDKRVMKKAVDIHSELVEEFKSIIPDGDFFTLFIFQPIPPLYAKHSVRKGGNVMGLDRIEDNIIMWLGALGVRTPEAEAIGREKMIRWTADLKEYAASVGADSEWVYLNYADPTQDPLASQGAENVEFMRATALKYDPEGVFQTRAPGGFKISKVKREGPGHVKDEL